MKKSPSRKHYRVGKKQFLATDNILSSIPSLESANSNQILILFAIIYTLSNIISFMLGRICYERRHY